MVCASFALTRPIDNIKDAHLGLLGVTFRDELGEKWLANASASAFPWRVAASVLALIFLKIYFRKTQSSMIFPTSGMLLAAAPGPLPKPKPGCFASGPRADDNDGSLSKRM